MDAAVRFAIQQVGLPAHAAFTAATGTPARMLGLSDRGRLEAGTRADLCHMSDDLALTAVWAAGAPVAR
jgi:N-acetylglucosamine-6-phosphate deacetylase